MKQHKSTENPRNCIDVISLSLFLTDSHVTEDMAATRMMKLRACLFALHGMPVARLALPSFRKRSF